MDILGDRKASLSRELTKHYEEIIRGSLSEILMISEERNLKGEIVLVVEGAGEIEPDEINIREELGKRLEAGMSKKEAVKEIIKTHDLPRNQVYQESLNLD